MKHFISNIICMLLLPTAVCACTDDLEIRQSYEYKIETLPLPKSLERGETVALEFSIVREGYYTGTSYKFRYFQSEGKGKLTGYYGDDIPVNRFQNILSDNFVLYYESRCEEQQQLDFVFEDNFGQRVEYSITFGNRKPDDEPDSTPETPQPDPDDSEPEEEPGGGISPDDETKTVPGDDETAPDGIPDSPEDETGTDCEPVENPDGSTLPGEGTKADPDGETENNQSAAMETNATSGKETVIRKHEQIHRPGKTGCPKDVERQKSLFIPSRTPQDGCRFDGSRPRFGA
jgi:hypothetical protein